CPYLQYAPPIPFNMSISPICPTHTSICPYLQYAPPIPPICPHLQYAPPILPMSISPIC
ncbi:predicted protein, partial [Nematostella vectensis]